MTLKANMIKKTKAEIKDLQARLDSHREDLDWADDHNDPHGYSVICNVVSELIDKLNKAEKFLAFLEGKR